MADFFEKPEDAQEENSEEQDKEAEETSQEKIKIGESEYDPDELKGMVELAGKVKGFEEKSGTDFDKLTSEFGKRGQTIGDLRKELDEIKAAKTQEKVETGAELTIDEQRKQALEEADRLGIITKENIRGEITRELKARDILNDCKDFESKIDGSDGRPAFKTQDMLQFMSEKGGNLTLEEAYYLKYRPQIERWREDQLSKARPGGLVTESSSSAGGKQPPTKRITTENLTAAIHEELYGAK